MELFIMETCPYCRKVMNFFEDHKIEYEKRDITDFDTRRELIELGGKEQVPFLYIAEKNLKMYESDDIIEYVRSNVQ